MNPKWRRYAPIGLYVAVLAAFLSGLLYFLRRDFDIYLQISLALVVIGLASYVLLDPDKVRQAFSGRQARYGSNALVILLAALGIVIVINYLAYTYNERWDLTEDQTNTLSAETLEVLASLPESVNAVAFYSNPADSGSAVDTLENYRSNADGNFTYEIVDPVADPFRANDAGITQDRSIVLEMGDQQEIINFANEAQITEALVRLMSGERFVYFLTGHGEGNPEGTDEFAMGQLSRSLGTRNYVVQVLNLLATQEIPADADVIVIAGPNVPVSEEEIEQLDDFLQAGGALVVLAEPTILTEFGDAEDPLSSYLKESWGITLGNDVVLDTQSSNLAVPFAYEYGQHPVTQNLANIAPFFPTTRSVQVTGQIEGISQQELVLTAPQVTWAETDLDALAEGGEVGLDPDVDIPGPVPVMVVAEAFESGARLVVFGDSEFPRDAYFAEQGNGNLLINAIDWASEQENLISLNPNTPTVRFIPPPQPSVLRFIQILSIYLVPGGMIVIGIVVWWRRRNRG